MLQARDAVERRSWSHPQEPTGEEWWAEVLADPRARKRERRTDLAVRQAFYRLADEKRGTILVACSKRLAWRRLPQPSRRTELQQARLALGSLRRALRRADRGRTIALLNGTARLGGVLIYFSRSII